MDILRLHNDEPFIEDVEEFFLRNKFDYFNPHEKKSFRQEIESAVRDCYFGVYSEGVMVAYGMLRGMDEGYEIPMLGIGVDRSYQGKGIGNLLMTFLETQARLDGYTKIRLKVYPKNFEAMALYNKFGYYGHDISGENFLMEKGL